MKIKTGLKDSTARYLIGDFLEMKTRLSARERNNLLNKIETEGIQSDRVRSQPALWMDNRLLLVLNEDPAECWFYFAAAGKMEKIRLRGLNSALGKIIGVPV